MASAESREQASKVVEQAIEDFAARQRSALQMGSARILEARRAAGKLNARERLDRLFDRGEYTEYGLFATSNRAAVQDRTPADGKIVAIGRVRGHRAVVVSNDFSVLGASSAVVNGKKIAHAKRMASSAGLPLVFLAESAGARIPDRMGAAGRAILGQDPVEYVRDRVTPWASALLGPCFGSSAWYACLSDFVVMVKGAVLGVASPKVASAATSETSAFEELGGWRMAAEQSGLVDRVVETEEEALATVGVFLDYLPQGSSEAAPRCEAVAPEVDPHEILTALPALRSQVYDVKDVLKAIVDGGSLFELKSLYARSILTGLARVGGRTVGIIANNPKQLGGAISPEACNKAVSHLVLCDSFNIPIINIVDQPGFLIGKDGEAKGMLGRVMNWMHALELCTVPKVCLITRKSYGQAYLNMGGGRNSDVVITWPTADLGFTDPRVASSIVKDFSSPQGEGSMESIDNSCWPLAQSYEAHMVIDPRDTRTVLADVVESLTGGSRGGVGHHRLATWPTSYV